MFALRMFVVPNDRLCYMAWRVDFSVADGMSLLWASPVARVSFSVAIDPDTTDARDP